VHGEVDRGEVDEAGRVRPCMNVRTLEGEAREDIGGEATRWGDSTLARATISRPLSVTGEWLKGVKTTYVTHTSSYVRKRNLNTEILSINVRVILIFYA
jgi:hypothetical protein